MKRLAFAILHIFLIAAPAFAFDVSNLQPLSPNGVFSAFSAESLPKKSFSFELQLERSREPDFYRMMFKAAYGITDSLELLLTVPYVFHYDSPSGTIDGMEDISIGLKHRLLNEGKYHPAIAYLIAGALPSGRDMLSTDGRLGGGIVLTKKVGPFDAHLNAMYFWPQQGGLRDEISFAAGLSLHATHNSWILAEAIVKKTYDSDSYQQVEARLGYRIRTADRFYTTIGGGVDFKNRHPEYRIMLSFNFTSPSSKKKIKQVYEEE